MKKLLLVLTIFAFVSCTCKDDKAKVLATVNGVKITQSDLEKQYGDLEKQLFDLKSKEFKYIKYFLDQEVENKILKLEADAQKITVAQLSQKEISSKIKAVTDEEIKKFAKERNIPDDQFDKLKDKIKAYLSRSGSTDAKSKFANSLKKKYKVVYNMKKPAKAKVKFDLKANDPVTGNLNSKIIVAEFSDFECPYCARGAEVFNKAKKEYSDKVKFVFKQFPLSFHKNAHLAGQASLCVNEQGKFFEYHDLLFKNNKALAKKDLIKYAGDLKLDIKKFTKCVESGRMKAQVDADMKQGQSYGISGTPAYIVDGELIVGAVPYEQIKTAIEDALNK